MGKVKNKNGEGKMSTVASAPGSALAPGFVPTPDSAPTAPTPGWSLEQLFENRAKLKRSHFQIAGAEPGATCRNWNGAGAELVLGS